MAIGRTNAGGAANATVELQEATVTQSRNGGNGSNVYVSMSATFAFIPLIVIGVYYKDNTNIPTVAAYRLTESGTFTQSPAWNGGNAQISVSGNTVTLGGYSSSTSNKTWKITAIGKK